MRATRISVCTVPRAARTIPRALRGPGSRSVAQCAGPVRGPGAAGSAHPNSTTQLRRDGRRRRSEQGRTAWRRTKRSGSGVGACACSGRPRVRLSPSGMVCLSLLFGYCLEHEPELCPAVGAVGFELRVGVGITARGKGCPGATGSLLAKPQARCCSQQTPICPPRLVHLALG